MIQFSSHAHFCQPCGCLCTLQPQDLSSDTPGAYQYTCSSPLHLFLLQSTLLQSLMFIGWMLEKSLLSIKLAANAAL